MKRNSDDKLTKFCWIVMGSNNLGNVEIEETSTHIWYAYSELVNSPEQLHYCLNIIDNYEYEKYKSFYFEEDRRDYIISHALLRTTLSRYSELSPEEWKFVENEYGRPEIHPSLNTRSLRFNLSRTDGLAACAVTVLHDVGIDVENIERDDINIDLSEQFFDDSEIDHITNAPGENRIDIFYDYWTLKEAYVKARGKGLFIDLDRFAFHFRQNRKLIDISFESSFNDDPAAWQFALWSPRPRYRGALAVRVGRQAPLTTLRFHKTIPFQHAVEVFPKIRTSEGESRGEGQ